MASLVQLVLLIDTNYFNCCSSDKELERSKKKLLLCCLRLITEFGAQTDKGNENIRWSFKFYDSKRFKPDISQKVFFDYNLESVNKFEDELQKIIQRQSDSRNLDPNDSFKTGSSKSSELHPTKSFNINHLNLSPKKKKKGGPHINSKFNTTSDAHLQHTHSYILNKSLQEILLDYDWDRPDISSPVRKSKPENKKLMWTQSERKKISHNCDELNFVFVFTSVPHNLEEIKLFIGQNNCKENDFLKSIFDQSTLHGFKVEKRLRFHLVNTSETIVDPYLKTIFQEDLDKIRGGGIHELLNLIQDKNQKLNLIIFKEKVNLHIFYNSNYKPFNGSELGLNSKFWSDLGSGSKKAKPNSLSEEQGTSLVWEDENATSFLKIGLKCLTIKGSSKCLGDMYVKSFIQDCTLPILGLGHDSSLLYLCHTSNTSFPIVLSVLLEQNLIMILQLESGGLAGLVPWLGSVGCLVIFTVTNLTSTVSPMNNAKVEDENLLSFITATIKRSLKNTSAVEPCKRTSSCIRFHPQILKSWYPSMSAVSEHLPAKVSRGKDVQQALYERMQKKYRPQMPRLLSGTHLPPPALVDVTEPAAAAAVPGVGVPTVSRISKHNVSRAQKLVKKSKIITAQMRVKEQQAEEQEQQAASERKIVEAQNRARKSLALVKKTLNSTTNPKDKDGVAAALINLMDTSEDVFQTRNEDSSEPEDLYATAQAVINLALTHIKTYSSSSSNNIENELYDVLSRGVLLSAKDVESSCREETQLRQLKLQVVLRLEVLWVLGYSPGSSSPQRNLDSGRMNFSQNYVDEILKLLRHVSLKYNPSVVGEFLQNTVTPNYHEFLGETLVEIFEELNQPLPSCLADFAKTDEDLFSPSKSSVKSHESSLPSNGPRSTEEPCLIGQKEMVKAPARPLLRREASNRQIVVPHVKRLSRKVKSKKEEPKKDVESSTKTEVKRVCRNLFDKGNKKESLKRSHTIASFSRYPSVVLSPNLKVTSGISPTRRSQREGCRKRKLSEVSPQHSSNGVDVNGSNSKLSTPVAKNAAPVLVPETPSHYISTTIFNRHRLKKSTGSTVVTESPELKGGGRSMTFGHETSLSLTRRGSFYSGAISRNFEKGKQQLRASQLKGTIDRRSSLPSASTADGDSSFIFSDIIHSNKRATNHAAARKPSPARGPFLSPCMRLNFGLDDEKQISPDSFNKRSSDSCTKLSHSRGTYSESPLRRVRRSLSLATPIKGSSSTLSPPLKESVRVINCEAEENLEEEARDGKELKQITSDYFTPSKRVQFSFEETPSKMLLSDGGGSVVPKSILKTPSKSPHETPMKIESLSKFLTPRKLISETPTKLREALSVVVGKSDTTVLALEGSSSSLTQKEIKTPCKSANTTPTKKRNMKKLPASRKFTPDRSNSGNSVTENKSAADVNFEATPTQKENKFPSKLVTQFRNSTPSQFELLLHSPITASLKKRKLANSSLSFESPSRDKNLPPHKLSPSFNSTHHKTVKFSPSKGDANWDFKPLVCSPVKYLLNSSTEFEIISPSKRNGLAVVKTDVIMHEGTLDELAFRDMGHQTGLENDDNKRIFTELPLDQAGGSSSDANTYKNLSDVTEEGISEVINSTKLQMETENIFEQEKPPFFGSLVDFTCMEQAVLSPANQDNVKDTVSASDSAEWLPEVTKDGDCSKTKENEFSVRSSIERQCLFPQRIFQRDSDSGISSSIQSEEYADGACSMAYLGEDINKLLSSLASPVKRPSDRVEPELAPSTVEVKTASSIQEMNLEPNLTSCEVEVKVVDSAPEEFSSCTKCKSPEPVEEHPFTDTVEKLSTKPHQIPGEPEIAFQTQEQILKKSKSEETEEDEAKLNTTLEMVEDDDSTTIPSSDLEDNYLNDSPSPLSRLNPLAFLDTEDVSWPNENWDTPFDTLETTREALVFCNQGETNFDEEVEETLSGVPPKIEKNVDGTSLCEGREDDKIVEEDTDVVSELKFILGEAIETSPEKGRRIDEMGQEFDPDDDWYGNITILNEGQLSKVNQNGGSEANNLNQEPPGDILISSYANYSPEIPLSMNLKRRFKAAKMKPAKRKLKFWVEENEGQQNFDCETDYIENSAKRRKIDYLESLFCDNLDSPAFEGFQESDRNTKMTEESCLQEDDNDQLDLRDFSSLSSISNCTSSENSSSTSFITSNSTYASSSRDKVGVDAVAQIDPSENDEELAKNVLCSDSNECPNAFSPVNKNGEMYDQASYSQENKFDSSYIDVENSETEDDLTAHVNTCCHSPSRNATVVSNVENSSSTCCNSPSRNATVVSNVENSSSTCCNSPSRNATVVSNVENGSSVKPKDVDVNCTPRRSVRRRKPIEKFQSPLNSLGSNLGADYYQISPLISSRKYKNGCRSKLNSPATGQSKVNRQLYQNKGKTIVEKTQEEEDVVVDVEVGINEEDCVCNGKEERLPIANESSNNLFSPEDGVVSPVKGRLSDSFEIVSPLKKKGSILLTDGDPVIDPESPNPVPEGLSKSPIILRIRRKKKNHRYKGKSLAPHILRESRPEEESSQVDTESKNDVYDFNTDEI